MYRILRDEKMAAHRSASRPPKPRPRPQEATATGPNQVWSWDITYLPSPVRGQFYYLYMTVDIFSRKVVGRAVHDTECAIHAAELIRAATSAEGLGQEPLILHADNGGPMKGATMLATLQDLGKGPVHPPGDLPHRGPLVKARSTHLATYRTVARWARFSWREPCRGRQATAVA